MEDENYRNFIVSRLNRNLDKKFLDDIFYFEDVVIVLFKNRKKNRNYRKKIEII